MRPVIALLACLPLGDAAVDAVIKHEARLLPLYERNLKNPAGK